MLDWRTIGEEEFNRLAEQLIRRSVLEESPGLDVKAVDGRGGDGGIDVMSVVKSTQQLVAIYQLKFFREGFSGAWAKARKPQIQKSYETALTHNPDVWYLVVPRNLTPKERTFVRSLQGKSARPRVRHLGATELDDILARHPDLESWAERGPLRSALELAGRSTAALSTPTDLRAEVSHLAKRSDARSDYWRTDFSRQGEIFTETLVALREDSAIREPLTMNLTLDFTEHPMLRTTFQHSLDYGLLGDVVIPPSVLKRLDKVGPDWFSESLSSGELHLMPRVRTVEGKGRVSMLDVDGRTLASRTSTSVRATTGLAGGQLVFDFGGNLVLIVVMAKDPLDGDFHVSAPREGLSGTEALRLMRFLDAMERASQIELAIDDKTMRYGIVSPKGVVAPYELALAEDLAYIERELNVEFDFPTLPGPARERLVVRAVRQVLDGKTTILPEVAGFDFTLGGEPGEGLRGLLEGPRDVRSTAESWEVDVYGTTLRLHDVRTLIPNARVEDAEAHLAAIDAGGAAGRRIQVRPSSELEGVWIWMPSRGSEHPTDPVQWEVPEIHEHARFCEVESSVGR